MNTVQFLILYELLILMEKKVIKNYIVVYYNFNFFLI